MLPAVQCVPLFFTITPFTLHCIEALQYIGGAWPIKVGLMDRNVLALRKLVHTWSPKLNGDTSNIFACNKWIRLQNFYYFLLLVRYIPNVAKRSIWDQCKKKYNIYWGPTSDRRQTTDQRPTTSHLGKFQTTISPQGVVRFTSCLVLLWGFRGRRIEWRYFRFRKIQDGGSE